MSKVAFVTYAELPHLAEDDRLAADCLRRRGVEVCAVMWDAGDVRWEEFDAVVVRSCWEYHLRTQEFSNWIDLMEQKSVAIWNRCETLRRNMDKSYLRELAARGINVAPTVWLERGDRVDLRAILEERGWSQAVVKPTVSMSAYETWITSGERAAADTLAVREMLKRSGVMVQSFVPEVGTRGEWSFVFFLREYSHAVLKRPKPGDFRVQMDFGGQRDYTSQPAPALVAEAERIIAEVEGPLLYARVDGVEAGGELVLMELELIDPVLFLSGDARAPQRFADAIMHVARVA